jgi:hypothetical protein
MSKKNKNRKNQAPAPSSDAPRTTALQFDGLDGGRPVARALVCGYGDTCGQRNRPRVPVDWLMAEWEERGLEPRARLTIVDCLGPCDDYNTVCLRSNQGTMYIGGLSSREHYQAVLDWAAESAEAGKPVEIPQVLRRKRLPPGRV